MTTIVIVTAGLLTAVAGLIWLKKKKKKAEEEKEPKVERITAEAFVRSPKASIPLGATVHVAGDIYIVEERCQYFEVEDSDEEGETLVSKEDFWWVLNLSCEVSDERFFLSCEQDDNDCWSFWFCEEITEAITGLDEFSGVSYEDEDGSPPESFEYRGRNYKAHESEYDYSSFVISERHDRKAKSEYFVQSTCYQEFLPDGSEGDQILAFEMWERGMTATLGRQVDDLLLMP